jgi:putative SOS response-associated peptidase YedK
MCYRYVVHQPPTILEERFKAQFTDEPSKNALPVFNGGPTHSLPIITGKDHNLIQLFRFGLVPHWSETANPDVPLFNARAETIQEKPSYKTLVNTKHCLILADGFIEWKTEGKKKLPQLISFPENKAFAMAGLWDEWSLLDGTPLFSFTIITVPANEYMEDLHDRMPLILSDENESKWLTQKIDFENQDLVSHLSNQELLIKPISSRVNNIAHQDAHVLDDAEDSGQLSLF